MTAFSDPQTRSEACRLGASAFFSKPFDLDDLRTAVLNLISWQPGYDADRNSRDGVRGDRGTP